MRKEVPGPSLERILKYQFMVEEDEQAKETGKGQPEIRESGSMHVK